MQLEYWCRKQLAWVGDKCGHTACTDTSTRLVSPLDAIENQLRIMREEFDNTLGALLFIHPQNTRTDTKFEEAYFKLRKLLFNE